MNTTHLRRVLLAVSLCCYTHTTALYGQGATSPMDLPLTEGGATLITCELKEDKAAPPSSDKAAKGTYSYKLFLPKGYSENPQRKYPALFVMMPGGNAGMKLDLDRANAEGWIGIMLIEAKNGPWEPILGNMLAAHADVIQRVRIREGLKFATGFSGGARGAAMLTQICPGFGGVFLQGAGFPQSDGYITKGIKTVPYSVFLAMGDQDSNISEIAALKRALPPDVAYNAVTFPGGHTGAKGELTDQGMDWLLAQTFLKGNFPEDGPLYYPAMATRTLAMPDSSAKLAQLELMGSLGKKLRLDTSALEKAWQTLKQNPELAKIQKAESALKDADTKATEKIQALEKSDSDKKKAKSYDKIAEYYDKVVLDHAGTPAAETAKERAEEIRKKAP